MVYLPDPTGSTIQSKTFSGPVQNQLIDALEYIKTRYLQESIIKVTGKAEAEHHWNYPYEAVEEILTNAVYHRDYRIHEPVTVRITLTSIEITSFPGFHRSITDSNIENKNFRARIYRNRRIGDLLKELRLIEGQNTGFPNARQALQRNGSDDLLIEMNPECDFLSVTIPVHSSFYPDTNKAKKAEAFERRIVQLLENEQPLLLSEIVRGLGYKSVSRKLRETVKNMVDTGRLSASFTSQSRVVYTVGQSRP